MTTEQLPTEGELQALLESDPVCFIEAIDSYYRKILGRYINRRSYGVLDPEELADAYQETMAGVWAKVQAPEFDPHEPLRMVYAIARNVAVTLRRKKLGRLVAADQEAVAAAVADDIAGTNVGMEWRLQTPTERREFQEAVVEIIARLPPRQQMAAVAFVETFSELRAKNTAAPLAAAMSKLSGKKESAAGAMSAWRFAREKLREELARRGFGFLRRDER